MKYLNENGEEIEEIAENFLAVVVQHENDHLDGHLFIEKIGFNKRKKFDKEYKKQKKEKAS